MTRRTLLMPVAALAVAGAVALPITAGSAQSGPRTFTVTNGKETMFLDDVAPRTLKRGRLTMGDRIVSTQNVKIDGKVAGTLQFDTTITNRKPQPWSRFTAMLRSTLVLKDGELFGVGYVDAARGKERATIVGGTGAYSGATGTVVGSENGAVITLGS
ncbi:hypothetical protein BH20ACT17_BH20ACT17_02010 [soil metagenome]